MIQIKRLLAIALVSLGTMAFPTGDTVLSHYLCVDVDYNAGDEINTACGTSCDGTCYKRVIGSYSTTKCKWTYPTDTCTERVISVRWQVYTSSCLTQGPHLCGCDSVWTGPTTLTFNLPTCAKPN